MPSGQQQSEYEGAYREWFDGLSAEEQAEATARGLGLPESDIQQINGKSHSIEDLNFLAATEPAQSHSTERAADLNAVLTYIQSTGAEALYLHCLLSLLRDYDAGSESCQQIGDKHGVTKQRVCYVRNRLRDMFPNLPRPPGGHSEAKRKAQSRNTPKGKKPLRFTKPSTLTSDGRSIIATAH